MLYHVPGSSFYARTVAEVWFTTAEAAEAAGFALPPSQRAAAAVDKQATEIEEEIPVIPDPRDILLAPVVSEKSYGLAEERQYTFIVRPDANKTQIKIAVEKVFGVKVLSVNTLNRPGKRKRSRTGYGKRKDTKRAIVTISEESRTIDVFGGRAS